MKPEPMDATPTAPEKPKRTRKTAPRRELTPQERRNLKDAHRANLTFRPASDAAQEACDTLLATLLTPKQPRPPRPKQKGAFGAIIADVLRTDPCVSGGWVWRSTDDKTFTGEKIGAHSFKQLLAVMGEGELMLGVLPGREHFTKSAFTDGGDDAYALDRGTATRFWATDWLRKWFAENYEISHANWDAHFETDPEAQAILMVKHMADPVILRGAKPDRWEAGSAKKPKVPFAPEGDPKAKAIVERVKALNSFLAGVTVEPYGPHVVLRRVFAEGHLPNHGWKQGGRLYATGSTTTYQTAKKEDRRAITIDGKPTVELDIRASHLTILAGLGAIPRPCVEGRPDPYEIEGLPRPLVKQWVTMTISHGKRHEKWPKGLRKKFLNDPKVGIDLRHKRFKIGMVGDAILERIPLTLDPDNDAFAGWGTLQFIESEVILKCVERLAYDHGIAALPVHDSLIVAKEHEGLTKEILEEIFLSDVGLVPLVD